MSSNARDLLANDLPQLFQALVGALKNNGEVMAAMPELGQVRRRVSQAEGAASELRQQIRQIDDATCRYEELSKRRAVLIDAVAAGEKVLMGEAMDFGAALFAAYRSGRMGSTSIEAATQALLSLCTEKERALDEMRAQIEGLNTATGMLAKVKAKAEQAVIWGKVKWMERSVPPVLKELGEHVLRSGSEVQFVGSINAGAMARVSNARIALTSARDELQNVEAQLQHPDLARPEEFPVIWVARVHELAAPEATQVNGYQFLVDRCHQALQGKSTDEAITGHLQRLEDALVSLRVSEFEEEKEGLPEWMSYQFDSVTRESIWTADIGWFAQGMVGLALMRVVRGESDRTFLVAKYAVVQTWTGVTEVRATTMRGPNPLGILPGESLLMSVGDEPISFKAVGKPKVQRFSQYDKKASKLELTTVETQSYPITARQIAVLGAVTGPEHVPFRLEGSSSVEGSLHADERILKLQEWMCRMRVHRSLGAHRFALPRPATPVSASSPQASLSVGSVTPASAAGPTMSSLAPTGIESHPVRETGGGGSVGRSGLTAALTGAASGAIAGAVANAIGGSTAQSAWSRRGQSRGGLAGRDGSIDTVGLDSDGDGSIDTVGLDSDGDGSIDVIGKDVDADGQADVVGVDSNRDGQLDAYAADVNHDGQADVVAVDADQDGDVDLVGTDADEDGELDTVAYDTDEADVADEGDSEDEGVDPDDDVIDEDGLDDIDDSIDDDFDDGFGGDFEV